ncbi:MAG TPA: Fe-S cluster assembly protein SufD [Polyangiaceae bacterium LLY-WYZ-15_(1-7)]|nr:Fe-S cluster assembly protein SufD [Sandaracinus sp.]HJL03912.1 Fe-S cluster assembly protein SufD [Polyangiaceae bacterium LLY-WYZ-15_(1-7)]MBJ70916.1 Fe-S cluster assembly protein SufD [Sandaracinus sp.]HJL07648.1 Fe-S cluster assembly protein SufD [Polyangiaceae bacterium LLY-WYZ-15_(1-7)]HJL32735.1 Fe-S cluster assembly protein SufD [Polyangiaceae bacterium LLY-WYZ-15_(1-7)]
MSLLESVPTQPKGGPAWLAPLREKAHAALESGGLPTKKTEAWRFTSVRALVKGEWAPAKPLAPAERASASGWEALFAGGQYLGALDKSAPPEGVGVHRLGADGGPDVRERLGAVLPNEHFVALNTAMFDEAVVLHVSAPVAEPVTLRYVAAGAGQVAYPRVLVVLAPGAELTLVERWEGTGESFTDAVTEVHLGANAGLEHVRVHEDAGALVGALSVHQERDSRYTSRVFSFAGAPMRLDLRVELAGKGARAVLDGAYLVGGEAHVDHHVRVDHVAPHCFSQQRYRGVVADRGTAVFDGQAIVHQSAPASEAHQENRNLLLSDTAHVHTKPHLEIENDDVVASHGATVGSLDAGQLFYLRSRGVPADTARAILTYAFLEALVDEVRLPALAKELQGDLLDRLPEGDVLRAFEVEEEL